jgi:hypothetical protein
MKKRWLLAAATCIGPAMWVVPTADAAANHGPMAPDTRTRPLTPVY